MIFRTVTASLLGAMVIAYTPSAAEILSRMEAVLRRVDPVQARVVRMTPDDAIVEETTVSLPAEAGVSRPPDQGLDLPFSLMTLPPEDLVSLFPGITGEGSRVTLGRFEGAVCYILEGGGTRLWISKEDYLPVRSQFPPGARKGTDYRYRDMVQLSEKVRYPGRTEVWRNGDLLMVEELRPSPADTGHP